MNHAHSTQVRKRIHSRTLATGILELHPKGYGFLRNQADHLRRSSTDVFASQKLRQRYELRVGDSVSGPVRDGRLIDIKQINGLPATERAERPRFVELRATNPTRRIQTEHRADEFCTRVLDLLCPIGFGQRALIAAPPRCGKTTLLQHLARGISSNHDEAKVMLLLIDERPEEVTALEENTSAEVYASGLDEALVNHARLAELVFARCQRLVECGQDVVLLVDSLTRITRAYNKLPGDRGLIGPGGLRVGAVETPRRLFSSGRAFKDHDGSLTVIATALVGTDNRMDEAIFQEFKGTGNTDIVLSQKLADNSVWPAIDIRGSATRRCDLLLDQESEALAAMLRRSLLKMPSENAIEMLKEKMSRTGSNRAFLQWLQASSNK